MFQIYNLSRENTQPENMCDIVFEKQKVTVRQQTERVLMQKDSKDSFKKLLWEISQNSEENICAGIFIDEYQIQLKKSVLFRENQYLSEGHNSWIFLSFSFSILSDEMVLLCNMFYQDIFIINKESHWL